MAFDLPNSIEEAVHSVSVSTYKAAGGMWETFDRAQKKSADKQQEENRIQKGLVEQRQDNEILKAQEGQIVIADYHQSDLVVQATQREQVTFVEDTTRDKFNQMLASSGV